MSLSLTLSLSVYMSVSLSLCLSVYMSMCLSHSLSICLSVWQYLCIGHPPNKRSLVQRGGIPLIIRGLSYFQADEEVNYQGFAVLFSLLADDPQTKVSLSDCRQMALANGIVDLCQNCQKKFRQNKGLQGLTASVLDILVTEYS
jgi:hypothetical protein